MTITVQQLEEIAGAATHAFDLRATFGGEAWDLTGATVNLIFRSPAGVEASKTATLTDAAAGEARYTTAITDLAPTARRERWTRCWRIRQGDVDERSLPIPFWLVRSP